VSKLLCVYQYIFYNYYRLQRFWLDPAAEYGALACLLIVQGLNLWTLLGLAEWISGVRFLPPLSSLQTLGILAILAVPQWFVFIHRARFKGIAQRLLTSLLVNVWLARWPLPFTLCFLSCC
jgi:hypothetical protein